MIEIQQREEIMRSKDAIVLFREILGDPDIKDSLFYSLVTDKKLSPVSSAERHWRYRRSDVERVARERLQEMQELDALLSMKQAIERVEARGITLRNRELERMAENGRLPTTKRFGRQRFFRPEDVDQVIAQLVDVRALRASVEGLMETTQALAWINQRLEEQGRKERVPLGTFYKQIERGIIVPDERTPFSNQNTGVRYYFSEQTLSNHPIFVVLPDEIPELADVTPVRVTGSKSLRLLEARWGDLVTRHGIKEEGLSPYAVNRKVRRVKPVGFDGLTQWFPAQFIPEKRTKMTKASRISKKILES